MARHHSCLLSRLPYCSEMGDLVSVSSVSKTLPLAHSLTLPPPTCRLWLGVFDPGSVEELWVDLELLQWFLCSSSASPVSSRVCPHLHRRHIPRRQHCDFATRLHLIWTRWVGDRVCASDLGRWVPRKITEFLLVNDDLDLCFNM